ncbi:hypothetical protein PIB30_057398, partial [Stylosanthes scabra]|nr:hypothetical protein [Stylosanthes scabra]
MHSVSTRMRRKSCSACCRLKSSVGLNKWRARGRQSKAREEVEEGDGLENHTVAVTVAEWVDQFSGQANSALWPPLNVSVGLVLSITAKQETPRTSIASGSASSLGAASPSFGSACHQDLPSVVRFCAPLPVPSGCGLPPEALRRHSSPPK